MSNATSALRGVFRVFWYEYPAGQGAYGSGGWSRNAKRRPAPVLKTRAVQAIEMRGKSIIIDGIRKLKCTIVHLGSGNVIRDDYGINRIRQEFGDIETIVDEPETKPRFPALGERKFAI